MNLHITIGEIFMNYTKIENNKVYFIVKEKDEWKEITEISGEDILALFLNLPGSSRSSEAACFYIPWIDFLT